MTVPRRGPVATYLTQRVYAKASVNSGASIPTARGSRLWARRGEISRRVGVNAVQARRDRPRGQNP